MIIAFFNKPLKPGWRVVVRATTIAFGGGVAEEEEQWLCNWLKTHPSIGGFKIRSEFNHLPHKRHLHIETYEFENEETISVHSRKGRIRGQLLGSKGCPGRFRTCKTIDFLGRMKRKEIGKDSIKVENVHSDDWHKYMTKEQEGAGELYWWPEFCATDEPNVMRPVELDEFKQFLPDKSFDFDSDEEEKEKKVKRSAIDIKGETYAKQLTGGKYTTLYKVQQAMSRLSGVQPKMDSTSTKLLLSIYYHKNEKSTRDPTDLVKEFEIAKKRCTQQKAREVGFKPDRSQKVLQRGNADMMYSVFANTTGEMIKDHGTDDLGGL